MSESVLILTLIFLSAAVAGTLGITVTYAFTRKTS